jgi:signal transduction histidine kinase
MSVRLSPRVFDALLAGAVILAGVAETLLAAGVDAPRWRSAVVAAVSGALLLVRRRHPVALTAALGAIAVPQAALLVDVGELIASFFPALIAAYGAGAYAEPRGARCGLAILLVAIAGIGVVDAAAFGSVFFPATIMTLCWLVGRDVRTRTRLAAELHEGAARLAEQREAEAREAVAEERRRIAREMHDVVAHSISIMVIQAAGARQILRLDAGRAEEAAARIGRAGRDALTEMQLVVGALESVPAGGAAPTLDALEALAERARHAGLDVALHVRGTPRALPPGAELAAYRVVQESLTNAIKHAGGAPTEVVVEWGERTLELRVADRGTGRAAAALQGGGHGLVGMRERLRHCGGELHAGRRPGGGFEVVARIPVEAREAVAT